MKRLSVLLVEDSALFRSALTNVLAEKGKFAVSACGSRTFLKRLSRADCDVAVIDAVTWLAGTPPLAEAVGRMSDLLPVILLGREDQLGRYLEALRAGVLGFVKQTAAPGTLVTAVRVVASGRVWFDTKVFQEVLPSTFGKGGKFEFGLSQTEQKVLNLVVVGKTNKEIGAHLGLAERTIKGHVSNLLRKAGVSTRSALASHALTQGLARLGAT